MKGGKGREQTTSIFSTACGQGDMTANTTSYEQADTEIRVSSVGNGQAFILACLQSHADTARAVAGAFARIAEVLEERKLAIVQERLFGSLSVEAAVMKARNTELRERGIRSDGPVTYVEGRPPWGEGFAGVIIRAVPADDAWTIFHNDVPCGRGWRGNGATYLALQNISGRNDAQYGRESRRVGARRMIERAERILRDNGTSYRNVVRTWFYLADILDWYAEFNKVRNEKYGEFGIMPGPGDKTLLLPASTGIRGATPSGAAATADLLAVVENGGTRPEVKKMTNTAQLDAFRYGSAFSRGALVREAGLAMIQVSGTAAIDERGLSLYPGDIRSQIRCTLDKIEALLELEGAGLGDICAATVYVKSPGDEQVFREITGDRGLEAFPAVCVVADVCREELLFEMDAEAVVNKERVRI
jgi:enamine deaminase RidA (YjgF/YER057c/UK114 family)